MRTFGKIWRERLWWWLPALVFFLLNLGLLSAYRLIYAGRLQALERSLELEDQRLAALAGEAKELEELVARVARNRQMIDELYRERFSTQPERFTRVTAEIKELARRAGLRPEAFSYPEEIIEDFGLVKRSFVFAVEATYVDLRKFINLLELSDSFLTLEQIGVSESGGNQPRLRVNLTLSTLFAGDSQATGGQTGRRGAGS